MEALPANTKPPPSEWDAEGEPSQNQNSALTQYCFGGASQDEPVPESNHSIHRGGAKGGLQLCIHKA